MSSQNFSTYFLQAPYKGRSKVSHTLCVCVCDWPLLCFFRMHPFCVKVSQRENEWQASFTSTAYILLGSRNRKLLFADRIGCTIGRFFCANLQLGLGPRKRTNWAESEILPFAESNSIH